MSFKKISLTILAGVLLLAPTFVLAEAYTGGYGLGTAAKEAKLPQEVADATNVIDLIGAIVGIALSLIGALFFVLTLYAGGVWMTALGNSERVTKAKELLETSSIGLVIVLAAYAIARFVFNALNLK
ncbi:MAG: hypothetical protein A3J93_02470 [Candidatus Magasanikbacteria bacterium RIFOXYC2_FULL_42_28]|uniref:Uncharacterized protein n=1 Tax=Candidatus Magasanikbacteria bacterium RIFOXYC2_FULL_42_28 TaxID=1798704 RepID=A0A1F6NVN9_9BACT|nr:MAG: hypothetical protein A3J93_02470 [Candidatus Magasanikbacteria bacterium RIFOXYC2_FULL_42_28]